MGYCHATRWKRSNLPLQHPSWRDHWLWIPQAVPLVQLELLLLKYLSCWISLCRHSQGGAHFLGSLLVPTQRSGTTLPVVSRGDHCDKRIHIGSPEIEVRNEHSSCQGDENMPELVPEVGSSFEQHG